MPQHNKGFRAHLFIIAGQPAQQHPQNRASARFYQFVRLAEALLIGRIIFQNHTQCIQSHRYHPIIGIAQQLLQILHNLIQLLRMEIQRNLSQIFRNILGEFIFSDFQPFGQLNDQFVAFLQGEQRRNIHQPLPCSVPHADALSHLQNIGKMGRHLQKRNGAVLGNLQEEVNIGQLQHPRRSDLQIFQKQLRHRLLLFLLRHMERSRQAVSAQSLINIAEIIVKAQRNLPDFQRFQHSENLSVEAIQHPLKGSPIFQKAQRRSLQLDIPAPQNICGEIQQLLYLKRLAKLQRHSNQRIHENKSYLIIPMGFMIIIQQHIQIIIAFLLRTILQHRGHHIFQRVAQPPLVALRNLMVRNDNHTQIFVPEGQRSSLSYRQRDILRQLLAVNLIVAQNNMAHQRSCLAANIALPVHQELIQEVQRHDFLPLRHIRIIFLKNMNIGAGVFPVLFTARRFQQRPERSFCIEKLHHPDVMANS